MRTLHTNSIINMTFLSLSFGVTVLLCAACFVHSKREFIVDIDRINLDSDQDFLNITGHIRKTDTGVSVVDVSVDLHHNVGATVFVRTLNITQTVVYIRFYLNRSQIESEILIRNNGVYTSFVKGSPIEICAFFANPHLNPLLAMIMTTMNKYGNKMTSCPIEKVNTNCLHVFVLMYYVPQLKYDIIGLHMDSTTLPPFIPTGEYRIEVKTSRQTKAGAPLKMLMLFDCDTRIHYK